MSANVRTLLMRGKAPKAAAPIMPTMTTPPMVVPEIPSGIGVNRAKFCQRCGTPRLPFSACRGCGRNPGPPAGSPSRVEAGYKRGAKALGIPLEEYRQHRENGERWCHAHRAWEPVGTFVTNRASPDGLGRICRAGSREYQSRRQPS